MATATVSPGERPVDCAEREALSPRGDNGEERSFPPSSPLPRSESGQAGAGPGAGLNKTPSKLMEKVQAKVRNDAPTADYREDIVRSIFGEVGTPVEGGWEVYLRNILLRYVLSSLEANWTAPAVFMLLNIFSPQMATLCSIYEV